MQADRRLYVSQDGRLVAEHDPAAAFLLAGKGQEIPAETVKRLGLVEVGGRVQQGGPAAAEPARADMDVPAEPEADTPARIIPPESRRRRRNR